MKIEIIPMIPKENEMIPKEKKRQQACYMYKKRFSTDDDNKKYFKVKDHCHYT